MFVNKIGNNYNNVNFKGYRVVTDNYGRTAFHFTYPYDYDNKEGRKLYIEFFDIKKNVNNYGGVEATGFDRIQKVPMSKDGIIVEKSNLRRGYRLVEEFADGRRHVFADSGNQYRYDGQEVNPNDPNRRGEFCVINKKSATSMVNTQSVQIIPDLIRPNLKIYDYKSDKTGETYSDSSIYEKQRWLDSSHSTMSGGNIAGVIKEMEDLAERGIDVVNMTPFTNGGIFSHSYSNVNNNAIDESKGTAEDYANFVRKKVSYGVKSVYDVTLTSENITGIHVQYMLKWLYAMGITGLDSSGIIDEFFMVNGLALLNMAVQYGILPGNALEHAHMRFVNTPRIPVEDPATGKVHFEVNPKYNPKKEPYVQLYDARKVSDALVKDTTKIIKAYDKPESDGNVLDGIRYDQTVYPYPFELTAKDIEEIESNILRNQEKGIPWYSTENLSTSRFKVGTVTEGLYTWDNNADLIRFYNVLNGIIESFIQEIKDKDVAVKVREQFQRGLKQSLSIKLESLRFNLQRDLDIVNLSFAQAAEQIKSEDDIYRLIAQGKMSPLLKLNDEQINNIRTGDWYKATTWGSYDRNKTTVRALMKYPLDSIELANNTLGVLSSTYLASRGVDDETVTKTRFELMEMGNPHVDSEHSRTYNELNNFYNNELRLLTDKVIDSLNEKLPERLIDEDGNYTEYGEYIVNLIAPHIVKFAVLKSLGKEHFSVKMLENGDLTYDYSEIRENTSLASQGIKEETPKAEALKQVLKLKEENLNTKENIDLLTKSFMKKLAGTTVEGLRMADAITKEIPLTIIRLDALKDFVDWDSVRALMSGYDTTIEDLVSIIKSIVQVVKSVNENIVIVAEFTDLQKWLDLIGGSRFRNQDDVLAYIFNETGLNSEMGYSYFFDNLYNGNIWKVKEAFRQLIYKHDPDYVRGLVSFIGNHDKPRVATLYAMNMNIFNAKDFRSEEKRNDGHSIYMRELAMKIMHKVDSLDELTPEIRENINNLEYFREINPRALAMSELLRRSVIGNGVNLSPEEKSLIYQAIADMNDGNYMGFGDGVTDGREREKENYASRDIMHNIHSIIDQARYIAEKKGVSIERFNDPKLREELETQISRNALEPAMNKLAAIMEFLSALPGIPTMYYGDNMGMTGYEDECRNPELQNRNPMFAIEDMPDGPMKEWIKEIMAKFEKGMQARSAIGIDPLNDGCCYELRACGDNEQEIDCVFTFLAHSDRGSVVSILNYNGLGNPTAIDTDINYIAFPKETHISLPVGTMLYNAEDLNDDSKYIIQYIDAADEYRLYKYGEIGKPIKVKGWTLKLSTTDPKVAIGEIEKNKKEMTAKIVKEAEEKQDKTLDINKLIPYIATAACCMAGFARKVGKMHLR